MAITLNQIPGFADVADSNFVAEQFAIGLSFQRTVDNAKFGVVRPEVFVNRYKDGDTVVLPTSIVDGYTYSREELTYLYHYALSGGTSTGNNGAPSAAGAIRYMAPFVDQLTGAVTTTVEYLVANGSGPSVTKDGTIEVFTIATRRLTSLVVAAPPSYVPVLDTEVATDDAITQSLMQRINRNAKFAALRAEIIYMGEFVNGDTIPQPVSPADGYVYSYAEAQMQGCWRWTTQGDQLVDPPDPNHKQIQDINFAINATTGAVGTETLYYNSGYYPSSDGRIVVFAFCQRNVTMGAGVVDFVDLSVDFLASGRVVREDVLARHVENIRYAMVRREFFQSDHFNGDTVSLPVSPVDGYAYSRDELTYVYDFLNTGPGGTAGAATDIRISSWVCTIDQATGIVSLIITRVHDGGGLVQTNNGQVRVMVVARRDHAGNSPTDLQFTIAGSGGVDFSALQNGGFDAWNKPTDQTAAEWALNSETGTGYGAQADGLVSGLSQRLGTTSATGSIGILSSVIKVSSGDLRFLSRVEQPPITTGSSSSPITSISTAQPHLRSFLGGGGISGYEALDVVFTTPIALSIGDSCTVTGNSGTGVDFNGTYPVSAVLSSTEVYLSRSTAPSAAGTGTGGTIVKGVATSPVGLGTITVIMHFYDAVGDTCSVTLETETPAAGLNQRNLWVQIPKKGDTNVVTGGGVISITGTLDFIPTTCRVEFVYTAGTAANYVDFDEVTFISQTDPSIGQIAQRGSDSLAFFPAISFSVDDTTFTPDLDFYVTRADGTSTNITGGSPVVSGLTASTTYSWYPYLHEATGLLGNVGENGEISTAGVGTPPWLQPTATREAFASWFALEHLPFADTAIQITTAAPAAPPTGGTGGGGGRCFRDTTWVICQRYGLTMLRNVSVGDKIAGEGGTWLEVLDTKAKKWSKWADFIFNHGGGIGVVTHHLMLTVPDEESDADDGAYELTRAWDTTMSTQLPWMDGVCHPVSIKYTEEEATMVTLILAHPHRFYAGSDPDRLTLMTGRLSIKQCGCTGVTE